jgi:DNA-binding response OmpR family regulator
MNGWSFVLDEPARILVVDDDPILLEFAAVHLSAPEVTIETVRDGQGALQILNAARFDVALLDICMPGMDGFAVLERLRADPAQRHLTTVMLTGREDIGSIDRAYRLGATSFAIKPVNWRQLSYQIRYVLRTSKSTRELSEALGQACARADADQEILRAIERRSRAAMDTILAGADAMAALSELEEIASLASAALARLPDIMAPRPQVCCPAPIPAAANAA